MGRAPLSRDRILEQALELADAEGVEALTMRRLGAALGFEAMSLYRHVKNKDDLVEGMLALVLEEWQQPGDGEWRAAIRSSAVSVHAALRRHPWAAAALMSGRYAPEARVRYMDALLGCLRGAGFSADQTFAVYHLIDGHIFGFTLWEIAYNSIPADVQKRLPELIAALDWSTIPHLAEHRDQHIAEGPHKDVAAFELGLDLILDGLADLQGEVVESTPRRGVEQSGSSPGS